MIILKYSHATNLGEDTQESFSICMQRKDLPLKSYIFRRDTSTGQILALENNTYLIQVHCRKSQTVSIPEAISVP